MSSQPPTPTAAFSVTTLHGARCEVRWNSFPKEFFLISILRFSARPDGFRVPRTFTAGRFDLQESAPPSKARQSCRSRVVENVFGNVLATTAPLKAKATIRTTEGGVESSIPSAPDAAPSASLAQITENNRRRQSEWIQSEWIRTCWRCLSRLVMERGWGGLSRIPIKSSTLNGLKVVGWEAGIRTPIPWSRATCPTVGRPPNLE